MNSFRLVYFEIWVCGSLAAILLAECQEKNVYTRHNYLERRRIESSVL
jgi:hypothetical protein